MSEFKVGMVPPHYRLKGVLDIIRVKYGDPSATIGPEGFVLIHEPRDPPQQGRYLPEVEVEQVLVAWLLSEADFYIEKIKTATLPPPEKRGVIKGVPHASWEETPHDEYGGHNNE